MSIRVISIISRLWMGRVKSSKRNILLLFPTLHDLIWLMSNSAQLSSASRRAGFEAVFWTQAVLSILRGRQMYSNHDWSNWQLHRHFDSQRRNCWESPRQKEARQKER